jgi:hypothetical protein
MTHSDTLGVYRIDNLKFYSKLEAIEMHTKTGIHPHWDFNEAVFSSYNWTTEPEENILELYRQRAQQLRDQYDYIVLFWSGGADSDTVLRSFVDNQIKIDELVSYSNYHASNDKTDLMNSEVFFRTIPRYEQLRSEHPWLKFRVLDLSEFTVDYFNKSNKFDWIYKANMMLTPNCVARDGIGMKVKEWADMVHSGKKLCLLWGHDKPRLFHDNDRYCVRFLDIIDNGPTVSSIAGQQPYSDELFYWTPDLPKLIIKQAHLIKNYLESNFKTSPFVSQKKTDLAYKIHQGCKYWLNNHGLHNVIYPHWDINTFDPGKTPSSVVSPRDRWFFQMEETNLSKKIWKMGVDKMFKTIPDYWKNNPMDIRKGIKACWSKDYYLE